MADLEDRLGDPAPVALGTPAAFDAWAVASGPGLLVFAQVVTGNAADAADAVQDALVAVFPRWRRLSQTGSPDAYARRVIVNRSISWWRRVGRRERPTDRWEDRADPLGTAGDPTAVVARTLLFGLPVRQRAAVVLRYYEDLPFADIGEILDCPSSTARSLVHRGLATLRAQLEAPEPEGPAR